MTTTAGGSAKNAKQAALTDEYMLFTQKRLDARAQLLAQTLGKIQARPQALLALKDLVRRGCNQEVVLHELALFCCADGTLEKIAKHARGWVKQLAVGLKKEADMMSQIELEFMFDNYASYNQVFGASRKMKDVARSLTAAMAIFEKHTHGKTVRHRYLLRLHYHIDAATGRHRHRQIAHLVAAMEPTSHQTVVHLTDKLRQIIRRREKDDPDFCGALKKAVERDFSSWQYFFGPGRR